MSIRVKAALVIILIVCAVTSSSLFLNLSLTKRHLIEAIEQDLILARDIVDDLVSTKIRLLKSHAATVAERLLKTDSAEEMVQIMGSQLDEFPEFTGLAVYDRKHGIVADYGEPVREDIIHENYIQMAFEGEEIISTTHYNGIGSFIMHVFAPMGQDMVLSTTFSGMVFADLLSGYRLWQTGSIFMLDETGVVIAHYRSDLVRERRNYIIKESGTGTTKESAAMSAFFKEIISNEMGVGTYHFEGKQRFCAYKHVASSVAGWRIVVSFALDESPEAGVQYGLLLSALFFMAMGVIISIFVSGRVVRPFYKIEEQNRNLAELSETARIASEAKSKFLANMSHEMRTPLNVIIGLSELTLESEETKGENYSNLEKICGAGVTLLNTVNDILDISKIESGKFDLIPVEYDIPSLINDAVTQSIMHIGEKPIRFILDINEKLPARLYGDELRIKQIFNNLLSNAFKYTQEGEVELGIECVWEGEAAWMTIRVRDNGIGIRPEDLDNLFYDYTRMDIRSNRKVEGTGLGLPITKSLAEMMHGEIAVESEYGKGSVFTVRILQKFVTEAVIGPEVVSSLKGFHYSDQKRRYGTRLVRVSLPYARVLLVDDVLTNLDVAKGMMKPYGMQIDCVTSGQQAIDAIRSEKVRYNAVFMDHMMPGVDGLEATRVIREEIDTEYARNVPIIALTANAIVGSEQMFLSSGFQAFLPKPIEIARLDAVIRQWVRGKTSGDRPLDGDGSEGEPEMRVTAQDFPFQVEGIDLKKGLERFSHDEASFLQVLRSYAANTKPLIEAARVVNKGNLAEYAIIAHGIKGSSWGIGADVLGDRAESMEKAARGENLAFVLDNNAAFLESAETLVAGLDELLRQMAFHSPKPKKEQPDQEVLEKLLAACGVYDMDGVDAAMAELESFEYESDGGLVVWLRENVDRMRFAQIKERLSTVKGAKA